MQPANHKVTAFWHNKSCLFLFQSDLYQGLYALYPSGYDINAADTEGSGKLMVLSQLLAAFYGAEPQERVVLVSNYTQVLFLLLQQQAVVILRHQI